MRRKRYFKNYLHTLFKRIHIIMNRRPLLIATLLTLITPIANADLLSIAFGTQSNFEQSGGSTSSIPVGEAFNTDGLIFSGQTGPWDSLIVGNGDFRDTYSAERAITVGDITFTFNPGGVDDYQTFNSAGDILRAPVPFLRANSTETSSTITWEISGLSDFATYDIILFGQTGPSNASDHSIIGFDAGNGTGNSVTLDSEFDANFIGVFANNGIIQGQMALRPGEGFASFGGIQVRMVSAPAAASLFAVFAGLLLARRKMIL
jgi:hypothetical protein